MSITREQIITLCNLALEAFELRAENERLLRERDEALAREKEAQRLLEEYDFLTEEGGSDSLGAAMRKARAKAIEEAVAAIEHWSPVCGCLKLIEALRDSHE
jgi:hypothetical protein